MTWQGKYQAKLNPVETAFHYVVVQRDSLLTSMSLKGTHFLHMKINLVVKKGTTYPGKFLGFWESASQELYHRNIIAI